MTIGTFRSLILLILCVHGASAKTDELRTIAEVRGLSPEKIREGAKFELTAVVTFIARWDDRAEISVQDGTAGIYTYMRRPDADRLSLGDEVELRGRVRAGGGPPILAVDACRATGARRLPDAKKAEFATLDSAALDSQFVEVEGIVRDVQHDSDVVPPSTILILQMSGGRAEVFLAMNPTTDLSGLVDSKVRVRGVPFHYFNQTRQPFGFRLMTCDGGQIEVLKPAPPRPFELPLTEIGQLLRYDPSMSHSGHRVRVRGIVTLYWPGEFLYLQDGEMGILVKSHRKEDLKPGDRVDVAAFAAMSGYSAVLEDAEFRKVEKAEEPPVEEIPLEKLVAGGEDTKLVETEGVLESVSERNGRSVLMIRKGPLIVAAEMPETVAPSHFPTVGSKLRLKGVCQVELGSRRKFAALYRPESARLLLRSPDDIHVVKPASWWTPRRLWYALGSAWAVLVVGMVWLWSLQSRNVRLKGEISRRESAEAEIKRREEERRILAADLHDSLEQSLTGVALQLQAVGKSNENDPHLELASRLLTHSRQEVHRAVRDLREPTDEDFDLKAAIQSMMIRASAGTGVDFQLELREPLPVLGAHLSHQLLHLAQEGVTNALKHADPSTIRVSLEKRESGMLLEIEDDGIGFDRENHPGPEEGHFGLLGMKERAARSGGMFEIDSATGVGTRLRVIIPVKS